MGIAEIISLISTLAPTVENLILHFKNPDGTSSLLVLSNKVDAANTINAQNIAAFQAALGTAPAKTA